MTTNSYYEAASGFNNQSGLAKLTPQPRTDGIMHPQFVVSGSLAGDFDGSPFCDLKYEGGALTPAQWNTLLGQLGLSTNNSNDGTFTLRQSTRTSWHHYNGTIYTIEPAWKYEMSVAIFRIVGLVSVT